MMSCSPAFKAQRCGTEAEIEAVAAAADYLSIPAPRKWVAARVVSLLSHYFINQQDEALATAVAEDWCAMLYTYPSWALANASRWWISLDNPRRHYKPLPGDIQARAYVEMEPVRAARITIDRGVAPPPPKKVPVCREMIGPLQEDRERRAVIAESLGLRKIDSYA